MSEPSAWIDYQRFGSAPDALYNGGSITALGEVVVEALPIRVAFGFQRAGEDWGEASWTAGDLR